MIFFLCFKQKTAYEMRISDWSSDVCSSDLPARPIAEIVYRPAQGVLVTSATLRGGGRSGANGIGGWTDRKSVVEGKSVAVRVDLGGRRIVKKKKTKYINTHQLQLTKHLTNIKLYPTIHHTSTHHTKT